MQSPAEAIGCLFRRERPQRVPVNDAPWQDTRKKWVEQGMPATAEGESVDVVEHFGFDQAGVGGVHRWAARIDADQIVEETAEWKIVRNGNGAMLKWWKNKSGTPEHIDFAMTSRAVWDRDYRPFFAEQYDRRRLEGAEGDGVRKVADELVRRRDQGKWTVFGQQFIWENMRASMGDYTMYTSLAEDPAWVHDFARVHTDMYKRCLRVLLAEAGVPDGAWFFEDLGYKDRLFVSPAALEALIFPYYAEMVEFFHSYGLPVMLHTCGYQEPAIPLIIQAGFDGVHPMEVKAGNDLFKFAERWGEQLAFFGGLDARILESGDRALIRKSVTAHIDGMKQRGARFVYGSDHSLSTNIDYQDFLYSLEVYREQMMY